MSDSDFLEDCYDKTNFYCVYLMVTDEKKKTYIGYTNDPENRIKRHNNKGGAKSTHGKGSWKMILLVHGFPNELFALKFEWAWQSPEISRRLKHIKPKQKSENGLAYRLRVLPHMLRAGPWWRLGLTIQWLSQEYEQPFPLDLQPPKHMPIAHGPISKKKNSKYKTTDVRSHGNANCGVCEKNHEDDWVTCLNESCCTKFHLMCIGNHFLNQSLPSKLLLPIEGNCPNCKANLVWSRLVENIAFQSSRVRGKTTI